MKYEAVIPWRHVYAPVGERYPQYHICITEVGRVHDQGDYSMGVHLKPTPDAWYQVCPNIPLGILKHFRVCLDEVLLREYSKTLRERIAENFSSLRNARAFQQQYMMAPNDTMEARQKRMIEKRKDDAYTAFERDRKFRKYD